MPTTESVSRKIGSRVLSEISGACGDLGTFVPHVIGAMTVAGLAPVGVLFGFGVFFIASGLFYGIPIPVQPMKAVSAVLLTEGLNAREVAATGLAMGIVLVGLSLTGTISRIARLIPQSVSAGLQLGLGLTMAVLGVKLILDTPWLGVFALVLLIGLMRLGRVPAAPVAIIITAAFAYLVGATKLPQDLAISWAWPSVVLPAWPEIVRGIEYGFLPQFALTLSNAVLVTAALSRDLFPNAAARTSERNLALSTGIANLLLAPLGAMPMCHGAGGLQAQYRFGARTGLAPVLFGVVLLVLALGFSRSATDLFALIPAGGVGALLIVAGSDLALSRRLFDARPNCWPAIGLTAAVTLLVNPVAGLGAGWAVELGRTMLVRLGRVRGSAP